MQINLLPRARFLLAVCLSLPSKLLWLGLPPSSQSTSPPRPGGGAAGPEQQAIPGLLPAVPVLEAGLRDPSSQGAFLAAEDTLLPAVGSGDLPNNHKPRGKLLWTLCCHRTPVPSVAPGVAQLSRLAGWFGGDFASKNSFPVTALQPESPTHRATLRLRRCLSHRWDCARGRPGRRARVCEAGRA